MNECLTVIFGLLKGLLFVLKTEINIVAHICKAYGLPFQ